MTCRTPSVKPQSTAVNLPLDTPSQSVHIGAMTSANISYTRNHLSEMLSRVKGGETILIVDRQQPVARLEPITGPTTRNLPWQDDLVRRGLVRRARHHLDTNMFVALPLPTPRNECDILATLLAEREDGR
ncbi:MAG: hypothetical protein WCO57_16465 [Verrucomicrobiota bacterium]